MASAHQAIQDGQHMAHRQGAHRNRALQKRPRHAPAPAPAPGEGMALVEVCKSNRSITNGYCGVAGSVTPCFHPWSDDEVQYLRNNWETMTSKSIARALGRSYSAVKTKGRELKLIRARGTRPVAFKASKPVSTVRTPRLAPTYRLAPSHSANAADLLRVHDRVAMYRCDADGRANPQGDHWRYGNAVLTDAEVVAKAERKGWSADAWRALA